MTDLTAGVFQMGDVDYRALRGALSQSGAKKLLLPAGPARYRHWVDNPYEEPKKAFDLGKVAHQVILDDPEDRVTVVDAPDWRGKAAREAAAEARENQRTPILAHEWEEVQQMAAVVHSHPLASKLLKRGEGKPEQTLVWQDPNSGVWCQGRTDWLGRFLVDYKTVGGMADPESFGRSSASYGYMIQAYWYAWGARTLGLEVEEPLLFVVQETKPPYLVSVLALDEIAYNIGRNLSHAAIAIYAECVRTGTWPGYPSEVQYTTLPEWFLRDHDEEMTV